MKTHRLLALFLSLLSIFLFPMFAQQQECSSFSGAPRKRVEHGARWLVSDSLRQQIAEKSQGLGHVVAFEQCHILETDVLSEDFTTMDGPHFLADGIAMKSAIAQSSGLWMMAIAPAKADDKMPIQTSWKSCNTLGLCYIVMNEA